MSNTYSLIGSDGSLEQYPDVYKNVTADVVADSAKAEDYLIQYKQDIEQGFLKMGLLLSVIDEQQLYQGRGYPSMKAYAQDPALQMTWPMAKDLIALVRDGVPLLAEADVGDPFAVLRDAGVTKARACLPLLRRDDLIDEFVPLVLQAPSLTVKDVKEEVKRLRGGETPLDQPDPAVFKAEVTKGEAFYRVEITCSDGVDVYRTGTLHIKPEHFGRFDQRFGAFIEYVTS